MASKATSAKENSHGGDKRTQTQQGGSGGLWSNQDEMKRYVSKLKSELEEQKIRMKRVHRDKAEEIKRLHVNLDSEKQKAIENVSKKLESDKAYELKKMKESVVRQKEFELRQVLRVKDDEMRALKQELQESKNTARILELDNKRFMSDQSRGGQNEQERRWRNEVSSLRNDKRRLEESLRIKSEADFGKAELIRKMKQEHEAEIRRVTRESKRESLKEFRQLKAVSREVELKNQQLAAKEAEMQRLEREKNHLGNELNSQRTSSIKKNNSFNSQKVKGLSTSQISESDFDNVAEEKIKKLKMRNSELVAIARKLEEKAKQLQEEKDLLEKSNEISNPDVGNLKKAFARQRARDLAERAKLLMNKDNEINNLKKEVEETRHNGFAENGSTDELEKIVHQSSKERLLLERQVSLKVESLLEEIEDANTQNTRLRNDNNVLKEQVSKLENFESKYYTTLSEMKEIRERNATLENACSEKDKQLYKLDLEKQTYIAKNNALQKKNNELLCKVDQLNKVEKECSILKENVQTLTSENHLMEDEIAKLRKQIENLFGVKKDVERLQQENINLEKERENVMFRLKERDNEISSLHKAEELAKRKYAEEVSGLKDMLRRLNEQQAESIQTSAAEIQDNTSANSVLTSTPKDSKCTQTSRPSSPVMSPIVQNGIPSLKRNEEQDEGDESLGDGFGKDLLTVAYNGTSSSTSFDLEKAGTRIEQLAASDSDEVHRNGEDRQEQKSSVSSEMISEYSEESGVSDEDTSYSADVSRTSDVDGQGDKTLQHGEDESDDEDPTNDRNIYIGSPLQDLPDLEEKLSIFIAKYNYDPMLYSPNENPEMELAFQAGDYLYVYGDIDEDGFYIGELMNGDRGLVPSNFVERIAEDEAIFKETDEIERRHEMFRSSLDHVLTDQLDDIRESDEDDLGTSYFSEDELGNKKNRNNKNNKPEVDQGSSEGVDSMDSDVPAPRVPSPTKLCLDRQFTNSALISWRGATLPSEEIQGYNIYVDGKFKTQVKGSKKTNAVVEDIKPTETYRLCVRTKSINGMESPHHEATMVFGPDAKLSPSDLRVTKITATSGDVQWLPTHSSYEHEIFVNGTLLECIKPGCVSYTINDLSPATSYQVFVRTHVPEHLKMTAGKVDLGGLDAEIEFTTAEGGLPEPPVNLQLAQRTSEYILLTWLPVTLSLNGYSNGYRVSSYKVYVNGLYCMETDSACVDSVNISLERLKSLGRRHDFSRMRFVVRTLSVLGESVDSNVVDIKSDSVGLKNVGALVEGSTHVGNDNASPKYIRTTGVDHAEGDSRKSERNNPDFLEYEFRVRPISDQADRNEHSLSNSETDKSELCDLVEHLTFDKSSDDTGEQSEGIRKPTGTEDVEINSVGENKIGDVAEPKIKIVWDLSSAADAPTTVVRRQPIVTRYGDGETESESYSTETKTDDTEEELIERFVHLEISEKNETIESKVDENKLEGPNDNASVRLSITHPKCLEATKNSGAVNPSEQIDSEQHEAKPFASEQLELDDDSSKHLNEEKSKHGDPSSTTNLELSSETRSRTGEEYNLESIPESGTSRSPNSLTMEHQSESGTDNEIKDEVNHAKQFQKLVQNGLSKDAENGVQARVLNTGPLQSESETETEYGPSLSVIAEVDEENLTDTNNPTSQRTTSNATNESEATLSNEQLNSLPIDSSKSSGLSGSKSRTTASDDEGFRTEDDVLDLLDDDDRLMGKTLRDFESDKGVCRGNKDTYVDDRTTNEVSAENKLNKRNSDNIGTNGGDSRVLEVTTIELAKTNGDTAGYKSNCYSQNQEGTANCRVQENVETNPDSCTTEDELTEDLSDSSCSTKTLKSDSLSSISGGPPPADHAFDTIMNTLSVPSNCQTASGDSNHNGNVRNSSERKSDVISQGDQSDSEMNENIPEQVRYFIALYSYDPSVMSPNEDGADEELPFNEGDIIKILGDKDEDGFYWGECKLKQGFVPSNMIFEVNINEAEDLFNEANNDVRLQNELKDNSRGEVNGELDVDVISDNFIQGAEETGSSDRLSFWDNVENDAFRPRRMKALFDYDPVKDSPNVDSEVELKFKAGQIIYVFGEMDDDGFFKGERNGIRGLVPSNFLQTVEDFSLDDILVNRDAKQTSGSKTNVILSAQERQSNESLTNNAQHGRTEEAEVQHKKKKNIFSKGRKIFKKAFK